MIGEAPALVTADRFVNVELIGEEDPDWIN